MWKMINDGLQVVDDFVWGVPLMVLILAGGLLLTVRTKALQVRRLPLALKWMVKNEKGGEGEVSSFGALCTALWFICTYLSFTTVRDHRDGKYRRRGDGGLCRRAGSDFLDGRGGLLRHGDQVFGGPAGGEVPRDGGGARSWRTVLLY